MVLETMRLITSANRLPPYFYTTKVRNNFQIYKYLANYFSSFYLMLIALRYPAIMVGCGRITAGYCIGAGSSTPCVWL